MSKVAAVQLKIASPVFLQIDRALVKNVLDIYIRVGMESMDAYEADFEAELLTSTAAYYKRKVGLGQSSRTPALAGHVSSSRCFGLCKGPCAVTDSTAGSSLPLPAQACCTGAVQGEGVAPRGVLQLQTSLSPRRQQSRCCIAFWIRTSCQQTTVLNLDHGPEVGSLWQTFTLHPSVVQAAMWITEDSCPEYMLKAEDCLRAEEERVHNYLHISTRPKLLEQVGGTTVEAGCLMPRGSPPEDGSEAAGSVPVASAWAGAAA